MLGIELTTPWAAFLYTVIGSLIIAAAGVIWAKFIAYHDEEDERDWDPINHFEMEWEDDLNPGE